MLTHEKVLQMEIHRIIVDLRVSNPPARSIGRRTSTRGTGVPTRLVPSHMPMIRGPNGGRQKRATVIGHRDTMAKMMGPVRSMFKLEGEAEVDGNPAKFLITSGVVIITKSTSSSLT